MGCRQQCWFFFSFFSFPRRQGVNSDESCREQRLKLPGRHWPVVPFLPSFLRSLFLPLLLPFPPSLSVLQLPAADPPEKPGAAHGRGLLSPRGCHMAPPAAPPPPPSRRHRGGSERGGRAGELASETALTKKIPPARLPKESFLKSTYLYFSRLVYGLLM